MLPAFCAALVLGAAPGAPIEAARVVTVRGGAAIEHRHGGSGSGSVTVGAALHENDLLRTGPDGALRLAFLGDRGVVDLGPGAQFEVEAFRGEPQDRTGLVQLKL